MVTAGGDLDAYGGGDDRDQGDESQPGKRRAGARRSVVAWK